MKLVIQKEDLLNVLSLVSGAVERRQQTFPILANVMLVVETDKLLVKATDLEVELIGRLKIDSKQGEPGETTVPARKLMDICRALPNASQIELKLEGERLLIRSGKSRFVLAVLPTRGFPSLERSHIGLEFSMVQFQLKTLLNQTYFSIGQEDVRYYLNGMLFELKKEGIKLIAADGHRLSISYFKAPELVKTELRIIVPRKGVLELMRLLDDVDTIVKIRVGTNHISVETADFTFVSKLIDVQAPHYERAIPKTNEIPIVIDRTAFKQALTRVSILASEKHHGIRLAVTSQCLKITANNPEQEEAEEELELRYEGTAFERGFRGDYLLDVLNAISSDDIKMLFFENNDSVFIEGVNAVEEITGQYFIMPLRL